MRNKKDYDGFFHFLFLEGKLTKTKKKLYSSKFQNISKNY